MIRKWFELHTIFFSVSKLDLSLPIHDTARGGCLSRLHPFRTIVLSCSTRLRSFGTFRYIRAPHPPPRGALRKRLHAKGPSSTGTTSPTDHRGFPARSRAKKAGSRRGTATPRSRALWRPRSGTFALPRAACHRLEVALSRFVARPALRKAIRTRHPLGIGVVRWEQHHTPFGALHTMRFRACAIPSLTFHAFLLSSFRGAV
jgi:hypothetical protein